MANLFAPPKFRALDSDGNPLSGGKVYTYDPGTTNPKTTYTDAGAGTPNANPVILDANGEADIWITGSVKIVLKDSDDVTQWTVDNISSYVTVGNFTVEHNADGTHAIGGTQAAGDVFYDDGTKMVRLAKDAGKYLVSGATAPVWTTLPVDVARGHIDGLILSNDTDADHDIQIAAGQAEDSTNAAILDLSSAITKQIDAAWAAGDDAGGFPSGLSGGAVQNATWYHVFLIGKTDGTVDAGFDTNLTAANLLADATGYTLYRRVGSVLTDGSANIIAFNAFPGGDVIWENIITDFNDSATEDSTAARTITSPLGVICDYHCRIDVTRIDFGFYLVPVSVDTPGGSTGEANRSMVNSVTDGKFGGMSCPTNTSSQIRAWTTAGQTIACYATGYHDFRGKDA